MTEVLTADNLEALPGIRHGFFTRGWGNCGLSEKFDPEALAINRAAVAVHMGVAPDKLVSCYQIHSPDVVTVSEVWHPRFRLRADAMVTKTKGIAFGILTADCGPLLFADAGAGVIGAAHAGWRGALTGVIENTIEAMEALGARRRSIHAALGACIGWKSYEVGPEFPAPFVAEKPVYEHFFRLSARPDHYMFNFPGYIEAKVLAADVASFTPLHADTCADEARFFSYRRDTLRKRSPTESLISVIALAE